MYIHLFLKEKELALTIAFLLAIYKSHIYLMKDLFEKHLITNISKFKMTVSEYFPRLKYTKTL